MHCSANVDDSGRVAVFFGLSGTGKTTLSADPARHLVGDDEHGWADEGVFNFEGGYAKVIRLSAEAEPEIYATTRTFGTVLENVVMDEGGILDLDDDSKTENTRAAYKLEQIANALPAKRGPSELGRLPDGGRVRDPPAHRAARANRRCTGSSPASPRSSPAPRSASRSRNRRSRPASGRRSSSAPGVYARMLGEKLDRHRATVWLVNTGWTEGCSGKGTGCRFRPSLLDAALSDGFAGVEFGPIPSSASMFPQRPPPRTSVYSIHA